MAHPLCHDSGWMYSSDGSSRAGVCKHRGGEHGPAEGSAWIARELWCLGTVGRAGQVWSGTQGKVLPSNHHRDEAGLRPCWRGSLRVHGAGGQAQAQAQSIAHVGDKQLWLSLKTACVGKGNQRWWSLRTAPSGGLSAGSPEPLQRDRNVSLVEYF